MGWGTPHFCAQSGEVVENFSSRMGREREELCQKKNKREREKEKSMSFFKTLNVPCV